MEKKTRKVFEMTVEGITFLCVLNYGKTNPYRVYRKWWNGTSHKKQVAAYANFASVIAFLHNFCNENGWGFKEL